MLPPSGPCISCSHSGNMIRITLTRFTGRLSVEEQGEEQGQISTLGEEQLGEEQGQISTFNISAALQTTRRTPEILDQSHNRYSSNQEPAITTMKRITSVAMALTALFGLAVSGCDKKTSDDIKQKAEETKQTVERKAKEAKEAADKQIEKAKPKLKEFGEKAKDATQDAMEKLKEATNTSPQPVSPTPAP